MADLEQAMDTLKLYYDYAKHLATLIASTAVVLVALLREETPWVPLILLAVAAVLALRTMAVLINAMAGRPGRRSNTGQRFVVILAVSWGAWIAAIVWTVVAVALS